MLANPPPNEYEWRGDPLDGDGRSVNGTPPGNVNCAWVQHSLSIHHLSPARRDGLVGANGSRSSKQSGANEIRRRRIGDRRIPL